MNHKSQNTLNFPFKENSSVTRAISKLSGLQLSVAALLNTFPGTYITAATISKELNIPLGSVAPTLTSLRDSGLVVSKKSDGKSRKLLHRIVSTLHERTEEIGVVKKRARHKTGSSASPKQKIKERIKTLEQERDKMFREYEVQIVTLRSALDIL